MEEKSFLRKRVGKVRKDLENRKRVITFAPPIDKEGEKIRRLKNNP